jgi:hypothetical protein
MSTINAAETVVRFALGREGYYYEATMWDCGTPWQWAQLTVMAWVCRKDGLGTLASAESAPDGLHVTVKLSDYGALVIGALRRSQRQSVLDDRNDVL